MMPIDSLMGKGDGFLGGRNISPLHDMARKLSRSRSRSNDSYRSRSRSPRSSNRDRERSSKHKGSRRSETDTRRDRGSQREKEMDRELGLKYRWEKTVFVSNIPYATRWTELKDLFREKVGDIMYCEIFEKSGKSQGVGAIEFKTEEDAERAIKVMNGEQMGDRRISVRIDSEGFKTRQAKQLDRAYKSTSPPRNTNTNRDTNRDRDRSQSNQSSNPLASLAQAQPSILGLLGMGDSLAPSSGNYGGNSRVGISQAIDPQTAMLNQLAARLKVDGPVTTRLFVASLDYKVDERKLKEVFRLAGHVRIDQFFKDRDGKSRGMAIVEYDTPFEALNAVSMFNNQVLLDRQMTVRFDHKPPNESESERSSSSSSSRLPSGLKGIGKGLQLQGSNARPSGGGSSIVDALGLLQSKGGLSMLGNLGINLSGTAPSFNSMGQSQMSHQPQSIMNYNNNNDNQHKHSSHSRNTISKVFVKNIPFSWDERKLKEKFKQAGYVEHADIKMKEGKSRGCALIRYSTPDQAVKGVELFNGSRFDGRTLEVYIDKLD